MNFNPPSRKSPGVSLRDVEHSATADFRSSAKVPREPPSVNSGSFRKNFGNTGEILAEKFLAEKGFEILARNFHAREGEVDIIAKDSEQIVFVEVKARRSSKFGSAIESVSEEKLRKVVEAGEKWLQQNNLENTSYRVDVIAIDNGKIQHLMGV